MDTIKARNTTITNLNEISNDIACEIINRINKEYEYVDEGLFELLVAIRDEVLLSGRDDVKIIYIPLPKFKDRELYKYTDDLLISIHMYLMMFGYTREMRYGLSDSTDIKNSIPDRYVVNDFICYKFELIYDALNFVGDIPDSGIPYILKYFYDKVINNCIGEMITKIIKSNTEYEEYTVQLQYSWINIVAHSKYHFDCNISVSDIQKIISTNIDMYKKLNLYSGYIIQYDTSKFETMDTIILSITSITHIIQLGREQELNDNNKLIVDDFLNNDPYCLQLRCDILYALIKGAREKLRVVEITQSDSNYPYILFDVCEKLADEGEILKICNAYSVIFTPINRPIDRLLRIEICNNAKEG